MTGKVLEILYCIYFNRTIIFVAQIFGIFISLRKKLE